MTPTEFYLLLVICLIAAGTGIGGLALGIKAHISVVRKDEFDKWTAMLQKVHAAVFAGETGKNGLAVEVKELRGFKHDYPSDQTATWMQFALITCRTHKSSGQMRCGHCISCQVDKMAVEVEKCRGDSKILRLVVQWMQDQGAKFPIKFADD
jgi:hypothetical protein